MFCMLKKKKHILLQFQNITQIVKKSYSFNDFKPRKKSDGHEAKYKGQEQWHYLAVKKISALLKRIYSFRTKKET